MKTKTQTHTPTPWRVHSQPDIEGRYRLLTEMEPVNVGDALIGRICSKEDAAHIVRCVNSHEGLLAACKRALAERIGQPSRVISDDGVDILREAIAKAEGKVLS